MFFDRMLARLIQRDGAPSASEDLAPGVEPAAVAVPPDDELTHRGRRERAIDDGEDALINVIAAKVLHGWLQNRRQTLYPLTLNFRMLAVEKQATLARLLAIASLAGRSAKESNEDSERGRSWLASVGADAMAVGAFNLAFYDPPALSRTLESALAQDLAAYAYVVGLIASDTRSPSSLRFLDYLEARLELPTALIRSATRKYRR